MAFCHDSPSRLIQKVVKNWDVSSETWSWDNTGRSLGRWEEKAVRSQWAKPDS